MRRAHAAGHLASASTVRMSRLLMIVAIFSVHVAQRNVEKIVQHIDDDQRWRFHGTPLIPRAFLQSRPYLPDALVDGKARGR